MIFIMIVYSPECFGLLYKYGCVTKGGKNELIESTKRLNNSTLSIRLHGTNDLRKDFQ